MTVINTNTNSLYAQQALSSNGRELATTMQHLATGKRINNAVDDVAGLAISTRLTSQIRGLNQAVRNTNDAISLVQTAEGATEQITNMLQRMRELAVQAASDTYNDKDREFLSGEFRQLAYEINRIAQDTQWNGEPILNGMGTWFENGNFKFQIGANTGETISVNLPNMMSLFELAPVNGSIDLPLPTKTGDIEFQGLGLTVHFNDFSLNLLDKDPARNIGAKITLTVDGNNFDYVITDQDVQAAPQVINQPPWEGMTFSDFLITNRITPEWFQQGLGNIGGGPIPVGSNYGPPYATHGYFSVWETLSGSSLPSSKVSMKITYNNATSTSLDVSDVQSAQSSLTTLDSVLQKVTDERAKMGAVISRLQFASDNLANIAARAQESRSRIEDADYSQETTELAKRNIIQQAAQSMLAQANQQPQLVLQLLKSGSL